MIGFLVRLNKAKNLTNGHLSEQRRKRGGRQLANAKANSNSGSGSGRVR